MGVDALQMVQTIKWCMELGVTTISVYAFSIENFKRNEDEVAFLMQLSQEKFGELMAVCAFHLPRCPAV